MSTQTSQTIQFPYKRTLGPVIGRFFSELTAQRIVGIRCGDRVVVPPMEYDPQTGEELAHDFVEVGPAGTLVSWTWVAEPGKHHPLGRPFAYALIKLDGADTNFLHVLDAGTEDAVTTGMRVAPRWRAEPVGRIDDIEAFIPGETSEGPPAGEAQDVQAMEFFSTITYTDVLSPTLERYAASMRAGVITGQRCPTCNRVFLGRGYCSVDALVLGPEHEEALPDHGVVSNYTIVTPTPYPGQQETEPFARASVVLHGDEMVIAQQQILGIPVSDIRVGMRVRAQWFAEAERNAAEITSKGWGTVAGFIEGWVPTGEPDEPAEQYMDRVF
ncbi:Zn-ribbon domain-containing OB-fold protein [Yinghuangia sp. YIM S10712]|uniref:Zn-ribbon domain-containing OB-fold protein n=1 Tax=Yinghuangia sp. YIM S10712 TaxID=3436930 RepID=UPI003F52B234